MANNKGTCGCAERYSGMVSLLSSARAMIGLVVKPNSGSRKLQGHYVYYCVRGNYRVLDHVHKFRLEKSLLLTYR